MPRTFRHPYSEIYPLDNLYQAFRMAPLGGKRKKESLGEAEPLMARSDAESAEDKRWYRPLGVPLSSSLEDGWCPGGTGKKGNAPHSAELPRTCEVRRTLGRLRPAICRPIARSHTIKGGIVP